MVVVEWLGRIEYQAALEQQHNLVAELTQNNDADDRLLLLEHPPTYTFGKRGDMRHLLVQESVLAQQGFALHWVDRGGDITYHGPGQLVGYPIFYLKRLYPDQHRQGLDLHGYVTDIEEVLILALSEFGITGHRYTGYTGVWVDSDTGPSKIAAIGIRVSRRGISSHGFALNVEPDLSHFHNIVPCGIREHGVTSLAHLLQQSVNVQEVLTPVIEAFRRVFQVKITSLSRR